MSLRNLCDYPPPPPGRRTSCGRMEGGDRVGGNLAPWPLGGIDAPAGRRCAECCCRPALCRVLLLAGAVPSAAVGRPVNSQCCSLCTQCWLVQVVHYVPNVAIGWRKLFTLYPMLAWHKFVHFVPSSAHWPARYQSDVSQMPQKRVQSSKDSHFSTSDCWFISKCRFSCWFKQCFTNDCQWKIFTLESARLR